MTVPWEEVATEFGIGRVLHALPVDGGLSNELWRVRTDRGEVAAKVMRANADRDGFADRIEEAFLVERAAFTHGVPCPEPLPTTTGGCLARVGADWIRVHRWVEGAPADPGRDAEAAARLLAVIHQVGASDDAALDDEPWDAAGWRSLADAEGLTPRLASALLEAAPALAELEAMTAAPGLRVPHVQSHGDLDPKNTLMVDGVLTALDWDAAGPRSQAREAVTVALDWTDDPVGFGHVLRVYSAVTGVHVPIQPWVFGGWVSAIGGWLVYNVQHRSGTEVGTQEAAGALHRLVRLHSGWSTYWTALGGSRPVAS